MRDPPKHTHCRNTGGVWVPCPRPGPDAYELLKTPYHRLVRSPYCGIVLVKEEGSWRDLEICASPKVEGRRPPSAPPSLESGGASAPLAPPVPTTMQCIYR